MHRFAAHRPACRPARRPARRPAHRAAVALAGPAVLLTSLLAPSATASAGSLRSPAPRGPATAAVTMAGGFVPVTPVRVLDTRRALGAAGPVPAQHSVDVAVAGLGQIPASGAGAVVVNVTVTDTHGSGFLTVYPSGGTRPKASNVNFVAGQTVANLATVQLQGGRLSIYDGSSGPVDVIADVTGYYLSGTPTDAGAFVTLAPARVLDTRVGLGAVAAPVAPDTALTVTVGGHAGVPATGVEAVVLNVTATRVGASGYLTAYAFGTARPRASNLNFTAGATVPNLVTTTVGAGAQVSFFNGSGRPVDVIADVAGYYLDGTASKAGAFVPIAPTRFVDSRADQGLSEFMLGGTTIAVQVLNVGGIPLDNVSAVVTNVTAIAEQRAGYLTAYPLGPVRDPGSSLNHAAGTPRANAAVVRVGVCGQISFYNGSSGYTGLVADASGYFLAADASPPPAAVRTVRAFGGGAPGALGNGTFDWSTTPVTVHGLSGVTSVEGREQTLAIRGDGTVAVWGSGPLGLPLAGPTDQGGCAIPVTVPGLSGVVSVASGGGSGYAVRSDGTAWDWGSNQVGQLGNGTTTDSATPHQVPGLTGVSAVAAGDAFVLALKTDGTVWGWGEETLGELGGGLSTHRTPVQIAPATLTGITAIAAGAFGGYALTSGGQVYAWGGNVNGQLGNGTAPNQTAHPTPTLVVGVGGTGTLGSVTQVSVAAFGRSVVALRADHTVVAWGADESGQLGDGVGPGPNLHSVVPVDVLALTTVTSVSGSMALESDGSVWTWGASFPGSPSPAWSTPAQVAGLGHVLAIAQAWDTWYAVVP